MKFILVLISSVLTIVNSSLNNGYSCIFEDNEFIGYLCDLKPGNRSDVNQHVPGKTDDDVKTVNFEIFRNWDDTSPLKKSTVKICQKFKNLKRIDGRRLKIEADFFKGCGNLKELLVKQAEILELSEDFLVENHKLKQLMLLDNNWPTLPENLFASQQEIAEINLSNNQVEILPKNIFKPAASVKSIFLGQNNIQSLHPELFKNLQNLQLLSLRNNKIADLPKDIFSSLENLAQLYLNNNHLSAIHSDSFGNCRSLRILNLNWNKIEAFDEKLINSASLEVLDMYKTECIENLGFNDKLDIKLMRLRMKKCFENYQLRQRVSVTFYNKLVH